MQYPNQAREALAHEVEHMCGALFERWCDRRSVIPLAYLMQNWPIVTPTPLGFRRLSSAMRQLADSGLDSLDGDDRRMLCAVAALAGYLG